MWHGPASHARQVFTSAENLEEVSGDFGVLHGLYWLTVNLAENRPLVLLVDDVQWCDRPSLRYLAYLLPRIENLGLLVVMTRRTGETGSDEPLLRRIVTDPGVQVLRPGPLSEQAAAALLEDALPARPPDKEFVTACYQASGGNPLLLRELARTVAAEGIAPTAANSRRVEGLGPRAVNHLVAARMERLSPEAAAVARAIAVLNDKAGIRTAADLAGLGVAVTADGVNALERMEILCVDRTSLEPAISFSHPLIRTAVYSSTGEAERDAAHRNAARILAAADAEPEKIAAHLLRTLPEGDQQAVSVLRQAARTSLARSGPEAAVTYLLRALNEPPAEDEKTAVLCEAGFAAAKVDLKKAAQCLERALHALADPVRRAEISGILGLVLLYMERADDAAGALGKAIDQLAEGGNTSLERALQAALLEVLVNVHDPARTSRQADVMRRLPRTGEVGEDLLDCMLAKCDAFTGSREALGRAHEVMRRSEEIVRSGDGASFFGATAFWFVANNCWVLGLGDPEEGIEAFSAVIDRTRTRGSFPTLVFCHNFRGLFWLERGDVAEAEADLKEAIRLQEMTGLTLGRPTVVAGLARVFLERGDIDAAARILDEGGVGETLPKVGFFPYYLHARAQVLRMRGDLESALRTAMSAGERLAGHGGQNPAIVSWRSEAALDLYALDRKSEARRLAAEEVELARRWGAPSALGRALRNSGLVTSGDEALDFLTEAVSVLEKSSARLEYAKALTNMGAALCRRGQRRAARTPLRQALDIAFRCGASILVDEARAELVFAGSKPRSVVMTGPEALTPSERRVAVLAAGGATNRQIAQSLYVTPKTVEVHLSAVYRKLFISNRTQLASTLDGATRREPSASAT
ncbi:helix-turn-helix transcriptional regulator [Streptomyces antibioticus]|uniref:helix-turn-helix transcriptional regulator n=1 Tax=Streptomyces antibioticus TaxID=1890 RepID=UPI0033FE60BB